MNKVSTCLFITSCTSPPPPCNLVMLTVIKSLFFLEGLLLASFSPKTLLDSGDIVTWLGGYTLAMLLCVYLAERSRKVNLVLSACMILSTFLKHQSNLPPFLYVGASAMIVPLTCAFTMMQFSPKRERHRWALQYVWLILGKLARYLAAEYYVVGYDVGLTVVFVILCSCIPYVQARKRTLKAKLELGHTVPSVQVYTPLAKLLSQSRYLFFLISVLCASFFFFYSKSLTAASSSSSSTNSNTIHFVYITEILTCFVAYFLTPRRIPPQFTFLLAQLFLILKCSLTSLPPSVLEGLSAIGFTLTTMANAQIVATHAKPGLEYTTCTLVDYFKSALAPALYLCFSQVAKDQSALVVSSVCLVLVLGKYYLVDYTHDTIINQEIK